MNHPRHTWALSALALTLILGACSTSEDFNREEPSTALITDADIDRASLELARTEIAVKGVEEGSVPDGAQVDLPDSEGQFSSQAVLTDVGGYIAHVRVVKGSSTTWQLWLSNQSNDQRTLVYEGNRSITSTTVNLAGDTLFFTVQTEVGSSNYDVYRLTLSNNAVARITTTSTAEADVSVSASGRTLVWSGINSSTSKRAVYVRTYSSTDTTFNQKVLSISSGNQSEPTVSGDGAYVAFVRQASSTQVMRFRKSNSTYLTVSTPSTGVYVKSPSVSSGGLKVAWGEDTKSTQASAIKVKTISGGSTLKAVSSSSRIKQPLLASDGAYLSYAITYNGTFNVSTKNLSSGQIARLTSDTSSSINNVEAFWQKGAYSAPPAVVTIQGTVTPGSGISSNAFTSRAEVDTSGNKGESTVTALKAPDISAPRSLSELRTAAQRVGTVSVIVDLDVPFTPEGELSAAEAREQRKAIAYAQRALLQTLPRNSVKKTKTLETVPVLALTVNAEGLEALTNSGIVASVQDDAKVYPTLAESVPLIGGDVAWSAGYDGSGWTVAVLDGPVDTTHPFLGGRVVDEACFVSDSSCPNGANEQTGRGSSVPRSGEDHGTHVAGIAAGRSSSFSGVARGANIMAVKVLSNGGGNFSDLMKSLEYVYSKRSVLNIAAVNMSLGGGSYTSVAQCDSDFSGVAAIIQNLRSVNIASIVAAGNDGTTSALSAPACISSAISIGATGDGSNGSTTDEVMSYSNSATFLDFWAPGSKITSSVLGGGFATWDGTSMATPHVAGAWAVLKQRYPNDSVTSIYNRFASTGRLVTDTRNGVTRPRIDVYRALGSPSLPPPPIRVKIFSSSSGALVSEVQADASGRYSFSNIPAGRYYVTAYGDINGDGVQGSVEGAGAFGSAAIPQQLDASSGTYTANIVIATPTEVVPNNDRNTNNLLLQTTYMTGSVEGANHDFYKLLVPITGSYTLETTGGCSSGSRVDTVLDLYDSSGTTLVTNDDSDGNCSSITHSFTQVGTYFVRVRGYADRSGSYTVTFQR